MFFLFGFITTILIAIAVPLLLHFFVLKKTHKKIKKSFGILLIIFSTTGILIAGSSITIKLGINWGIKKAYSYASDGIRYVFEEKLNFPVDETFDEIFDITKYETKLVNYKDLAIKKLESYTGEGVDLINDESFNSFFETAKTIDNYLSPILVTYYEALDFYQDLNFPSFLNSVEEKLDSIVETIATNEYVELIENLIITINSIANLRETLPYTISESIGEISSELERLVNTITDKTSIIKLISLNNIIDETREELTTYTINKITPWYWNYFTPYIILAGIIILIFSIILILRVIIYGRRNRKPRKKQIENIQDFVLKRKGTVLEFYRGTKSCVTIPESVNVISDNAFSNCESILEVYLPDGIEEIQEEAFYNCKNLSTITIPKSVKKIKERILSKCSCLKTVELNASIEALENETFMDCEALEAVTISSPITVIKSKCFANCKSLISINLPDSIKEIEEEAFINCELLNSIKLPDSLKTIKEKAFADCKNISSIIIPHNVQKMEERVFVNCTNLKTIDIKASIKKLEDEMFLNCIELENVFIPETVETLNESVFSGCVNLKQITLPEKLDEIKSLCFKDCSSLVSVQIPNNLYEIEKKAFVNCPSLDENTKKTLTSRGYKIK